MTIRSITLALCTVVLGCGSTPNLAGDAGPGDAPSVTLSITPDPGDVALGMPATFTITNEGLATTGQIALELMGDSSPSFTIASTTCSVLPPQGTCTAEVRFTPRAAGPLMATLRAADGSTEVTATVKTAGIDPSRALVIIPPGPPSFDITAINNSSRPAMFVVRNLGPQTGPLELGVDVSSPQFAFFPPDSGHPDSCSGQQLASGTECSVWLVFSPHDNGMMTTARTGTFMVSDGGSATATSMLAATVGRLAFTPVAGGSFATQTCSAPPGSTTFNLTNETWKALTSIQFQLTGTNGNAFVFSTTCGAQPAGGATCSVTVGFSPTGAGAQTGNFTATLSVHAVQDAAQSTQNLSIGAAVTHCQITTNPTSIAFVSLAAGMTGSAMPVMVTNAGPGSVTINTPALAGPNPGDFMITGNTCGVLAASNSCTVSVAPTPMAAGTRTGTLAITTANLAPPPVILTVDAVLPLGLTVSPGSKVFSTMTGTPVSQVFTITNQSVTPTGQIMNALTGAGATGFAIASGCMSLGALASCTISVTFNAGAPATATLTTQASPGGMGNPVTLTGQTM